MWQDIIAIGIVAACVVAAVVYAVRRLRGRAYPAPPAPQQAADSPMACASWIGGQGTSP